MAKTRMTNEERLAKLDADRKKIDDARAKVAAAVAAHKDPKRPAALDTVIASIAKYAFTKKELAQAWPRVHAFKARGPRKAKVAAE